MKEENEIPLGLTTLQWQVLCMGTEIRQKLEKFIKTNGVEPTVKTLYIDRYRFSELNACLKNECKMSGKLDLDGFEIEVVLNDNHCQIHLE